MCVVDAPSVFGTFQVAVAARRLDRLDALAEELKLGGATGVCAVRMDVRDETSIKAGVKQVKLGQGKGRRHPLRRLVRPVLYEFCSLSNLVDGLGCYRVVYSRSAVPL